MKMEIKIVDFEKYCKVCKYNKTDGWEEPCNDCLTYPTNIDSHKPVSFKEKVK